MTTRSHHPALADAARLLTAAALAAGLSGCALLAKPDPVQSFRFGRADAIAAPGSTAKSVGVLRGPALFSRAAAGDRILAITGQETNYVSTARWIAPAAVLFDESLTRAFASDPGPVRLLQRGEPGEAQAVLRTDVRTFEVRYAALTDPKAQRSAPTAVVEVSAALSRASDRSLIAERVFATSRVAGDNRVSAIVPAMDAAMAEITGQLVAWTNANAPVAAGSTPRQVPADVPAPRTQRPRPAA